MKRFKCVKLDLDLVGEMKREFPKQSVNDVLKITWGTYKKVVNGFNR